MPRPLDHYVFLLGLILPMWVALLAMSGAYGVHWTTRSRLWLVARVSVVGLIVLTASLFLVKVEEVNRSVLALFVGVSGLGLWVERGLVLGLAPPRARGRPLVTRRRRGGDR